MRPVTPLRAALALGLAVAPAALWGGCRHAGAQAAPAAPAWYTAAPLLASIRPEARAGLAQAAGVARLEDMTLYDLDVSLDDALTGFALREDVYFTNTTGAPLSELVLRVYANSVRPGAQGAAAAAASPRITFVSGACAAPAACTVVGETPSVIAVRPHAPIPRGGHLRVTLQLRGALERIDSSRTNVLAQGLEGMAAMGASEGAADYGLLAVGDGIASLANFYPVVAARRDGRWDRGDGNAIGDVGSDDLAHVRARIAVGSGVVVATSGVTTGERALPTADGGSPRRVVEVSAAMVRDFALLASPNLVTATRDVGGVQVRSHFLPAERAAGERVLDVAATALAQFERRFGPYPYADLDVVEAALVGGAGGVEFAGLVTVASMFYRPAFPTNGGGLGGLLGGLLGGGGGGLGGLGGLGGGAGGAAGGAGPGAMMDDLTGRMLEFVTAHEVAHQYWHGLVGSDSRAHPFVDEGLAQYSAVLYIEDRYGAERARREADAQVRMNYHFMRLAGQADAPVDRPASAFGSSLAYAGLVYGKGPYVYNALRTAVGDAAFFDALRAYVARYRFRQAPPRGFVEILASRANGARVRAIARRWLDERHGDDDLGRADVGTMMGSILGPDAAGLGPQIQQLLQMLGGSGLLGGQGGGQAGPGGANGQLPNLGLPQGMDLERLLREAMDALGNGGSAPRGVP